MFVAPSPIHGLGVFAAFDFPAGAHILRRHEREVTSEHPVREDLGERPYHCDFLDGGRVVLLGSPERHLNHCCDPNAHIAELGKGHVIVASRAIAAGEEITNDYCLNSRGDTVWTCTCGSSQCRQTIHSDFFRLPRALQLQYLPWVMDWFVEENRELIATLRREPGD